MKDHYAGMVKGAILSKIPKAVIVDISHQIPPFDLNRASFILKNAYDYFPKGTIHIIDICSDAAIDMPHIVVLYEGHYFIGADNGIFSLIFDKPPEKIVEIDLLQDSNYFTFSAKDVFVKAAAYIIENNYLDGIGPLRDSLVQKIPFRPVTSKNLIKGQVIYIDSYENVFTNITEDIFHNVGNNRPFKIIFGSSRQKINKISKSYKDVPEGEILALFSSTGHLQIAISLGNASGLLGLRIDDSVRVEFFN